jgi:hypothetical protein
MFEKQSPQKVQIKNVIERAPVWLIGWMFTIGVAKLSFGQGCLAIFVWPYYLGVTVLELVNKST